jgi:hypothetical protein
MGFLSWLVSLSNEDLQFHFPEVTQPHHLYG